MEQEHGTWSSCCLKPSWWLLLVPAVLFIVLFTIICLALIKVVSIPEQEIITMNVTDEDILRVTRALYQLDDNRLADSDIKLNPVDKPNGTKFFTYVNETNLVSPTYANLIQIFHLYHANVDIEEVDTVQSRKIEEDFLNATLQTNVMEHLLKFLQSKGLANSSKEGFLKQLYDYWFIKYSRSSENSKPRGSSGFEHVFVGELKRYKKTQVAGFHNWVQFYNQEKSDNLTFVGYTKQCGPSLYATKFKWYGALKPRSSLFIGTSPEYDLAIYTLCFCSRPGENCSISTMGNNEHIIKTFKMPNTITNTVNTAYPEC